MTYDSLFDLPLADIFAFFDAENQKWVNDYHPNTHVDTTAWTPSSTRRKVDNQNEPLE